MQSPAVSILLPVHQAADTLESCLRSIRRQGETRWQCVAVDDGSSDASRSILRDFAARDPRIEVVETPHRGLVRALNTGLERCRAPIVARMDADDWMHRDRLAAQLALLEARPGLAAVGCRVRLFPRAGLREGRLAYERWLNGLARPGSLERDAFVECPIAHPTLAIRRDVLARLGYREMGWPEDYDLLLRMLAEGLELAVHPRRLLGWRDRPTRLSRTSPAYDLERFTACKAAHLASGLLRDRSRYVLWGFGGTGRALRRALARHGRRPSHIVELHPGRLGQRIHGAPVIPPQALSELPRGALIASVAGADARARIRRFLGDLGWLELRDYVCAA